MATHPYPVELEETERERAFVAALTVLDEFQRRGLGLALLERLCKGGGDVSVVRDL